MNTIDLFGEVMQEDLQDSKKRRGKILKIGGEMSAEKWMAAIEKEYRRRTLIIKRMAERLGVLI